MNQVVELPARQRSTAAYDADLLCDGERDVHYRDGVGVLEVEDARRAIRERARECYASRDAAVAVEPLDCARYVRELGAILTVDVELRPVGNDQTLIRADCGRCREHGQRELAGGRTGVADREVGARNQWALARHRRDSVRLEDLSTEHLRRCAAHAARCAAGELVEQRGVPRIARPGILDVKTELSPLPHAHRRRSRLRKREIGRGDGHRGRDSILAREGLIEDAVDESPKLPLGRIEELRARRVGRNVIKDDRYINDDLLSGRDNGEVAESEHTAHVRK